MRLINHLLATTALILSATTLATAQQTTLPPAIVGAQIHPDYQRRTTLNPAELNYSELHILKPSASEYLFYIPYVHVDWDLYTIRVNESACHQATNEPLPSSQSPLVRIPINLHLYWEKLLDEIRYGIANRTGQSASSISFGIPPSAGIVVYAFDEDDKPILAYTSIPLPQFLAGHPLTTSSGGLPSTLQGELSATCAQHERWYKKLLSNAYPKMTALMFGDGAKVNVDKLEATFTASLVSEILADIDSKETKKDTTTITTSGRSRGASAKIPFGSAGTRKTTQSVTTARNTYGIVNREWLSDFAQRRASQLEINRTCTHPCNPDAIIDKVLDYFLKSSNEELITITKEAHRWLLQTAQGMALESRTMQVDQEITAALKHIETREQRDKGDYKGFSFEKGDNGSITIDSNITFKRDKDDWVPISVKAHVLDLSNLSAQTEFRHQQVAYGEAFRIAYQLSVIPKAFTDGAHCCREIGPANMRDAARWHSNPVAVPLRKERVYTSANRRLNMTYNNEHPWPIELDVTLGVTDSNRGFCSFSVVINGTPGFYVESAAYRCSASNVTIPPKSTYYILPSPSISPRAIQVLQWVETR